MDGRGTIFMQRNIFKTATHTRNSKKQRSIFRIIFSVLNLLPSPPSTSSYGEFSYLHYVVMGHILSCKKPIWDTALRQDVGRVYWKVCVCVWWWWWWWCHLYNLKTKQPSDETDRLPQYKRWKSNRWTCTQVVLFYGLIHTVIWGFTWIIHKKKHTLTY